MTDQATLLAAAQIAASGLQGSLATLQSYPVTLMNGYNDFVASRSERYAIEYARRIQLEKPADRVKPDVIARIKFTLNAELDRGIEVFGLSVNMQLEELAELYKALTLTANVLKKNFDGSFNQMVANETF